MPIAQPRVARILDRILTMSQADLDAEVARVVTQLKARHREIERILKRRYYDLVVIWFFNPLGEVAAPEPAPERTPSAEWTTAPEGPAVPVTLPETPMWNVPNESATPAPSASPDE